MTELSNDSMVPSECISLSWRVGYTETVEDVEVKSYALKDALKLSCAAVVGSNMYVMML